MIFKHKPISQKKILVISKLKQQVCSEHYSKTFLKTLGISSAVQLSSTLPGS